jgi:hypothetical protein
MPMAGPGCRTHRQEQAVDVRDPAAVHRQGLPPTNGWTRRGGTGAGCLTKHGDAVQNPLVIIVRKHAGDDQIRIRVWSDGSGPREALRRRLCTAINANEVR